MDTEQQQPDHGGTRSGVALLDLVERRLGWAAVLANGLGALDVFLYLAFLSPVASVNRTDSASLILMNAVGTAVYLGITLPLGGLLSQRRNRPIRRWLDSGRPPTEDERERVLRLPLEFVRISLTFWGLAALLFGTLNATVSVTLGLSVLATILLSGLSVGALGYLLVERLARPLTTHALASGVPEHPVAPGVTARITTAWALATGVPVMGVVVSASAQLLGSDVDPKLAAGAALFLAGLALGVGLLAILIAARSVAGPVGAVRHALARVEQGDFDARVTLDDGSEVGLLQAGFNSMAAGLGERERLRDLFGRHVGRDVARAALSGDSALGGEEREIAALFIDVVGSTNLASRRPPSEVVAILNAFFAIVVEVVEAEGGFVNKFEGDAALCVFGAPVAHPDPAGDALRAARRLRDRLRAELPDVEVGIGVSAGTAVAGNIGAERRFEYTVIGDPVNEAARLSELAKQRPERVLASDAALDRASVEERACWELGESVTLRGRGSPTRLATPAEPVAQRPSRAARATS